MKAFLDKSSRAAVVKRIDRRIASIIGDEIPIVKAAQRFVIKSGGKRIRPLTHYYFCNLLDYTGDEWLDIGAIGELIHASSLLHDDVIDLSDTRRGLPAFHTENGNKKTILTGDYLLAAALDHLQSLSCGFTLLGVFTRVIRNLSVGEMLQMDHETDFDTTEETYERIILGKTASLFGAMTEGAAVLTGVDERRRRQLRDFGLRMGRLFQVRDDYLDYFETRSKLGKEPFADFQRGLVTHPLIRLRETLKSRDRRRLQSLWKNRNTGEAVDDLSEMFRSTKMKRRLALEIEEEIHGLMNYVRSFPPIGFRDEILSTLSGLLVPVSQE